MQYLFQGGADGFVRRVRLRTIFPGVGLALFAAAAPPMDAQARPPITPIAFDVASLKPSNSGVNGFKGGCHGVDSVYTPDQKASAPSPGRCVITDARLSHLISIAWDLSSMALIQSGPDWIARGDERFDIVAKAEDPAKATEQQLHSMLQALLVERFQLKFHRETKEMPGFALMAAKNGAKLQTSKSEDSGIAYLGPGKGVLNKPGPGRVSLKARRYSMAMLASLLSNIGGHGPAIDKTGFDGVYDFTLAWDEEAGPSLSTALREQLGLRMESDKVPESFFVVDSAQRPAEN